MIYARSTSYFLETNSSFVKHTVHRGTILKVLQSVLRILAAFTIPNNVIVLMQRKNGGTLDCLACHVTATSKLLREVN